MNLSITFDERRLKSLQKKLGPELIVPPVAELIRTMSGLIQREAASLAPSVLAPNIDASPTGPLSAKVSVMHAGVRAMEAGRKPLVAGGTFPPPSAFAYISSDVGAQFAIARAVAQRGTKGRFFMKKAKAKATRELPLAIKKAADAMRARLQADT